MVWTIAGTLFTILFGSFLHFAFELSGNFGPVALIAGVNESTWEHLKIAFWPALIFSLVELKFLSKSVNNFAIAKTISLYVMPISIVVLFYGYTLFVEDSLLGDILVFMVSVVIGQIVSYKLLTAGKFPESWRRYALVALAVAIAAFSLLSYFAPGFFLFQDPVSGGYGIIQWTPDALIVPVW